LRFRRPSRAAYDTPLVGTMPEELAFDLSRGSVRAQEQSETQLREKATAVLSAASIVVSAAAVAIGSRPAIAALPFGGAAVAYVLCVRECGGALLPSGVHAGLLGSDLLRIVKASEADIQQMHAAAAIYLDNGYKYNQAVLDASKRRLSRAIHLLTVEILLLALALFATLALR
jgi:hypothetical protein